MTLGSHFGVPFRELLRVVESLSNATVKTPALVDVNEMHQRQINCIHSCAIVKVFV
ncbi:hypothetical protein DPMN_054233 [Dreissena polymorpha]|uniref:Uncharacterized protein n=1 Tax=Dreissena polymorpha TaxID=45954 RepID=A0A9D4CP98_DREPO|nr:hypothetical protein DPMN_054233 [Dreissena polymorpha]